VVRRFVSVIACCAAASAAVCAAGTATPPARAAGAAAEVGHEGRWLVDRSGRVLVLHGVNMVAKRPPYLPSALGFGADDARFLRAQGFSTVRLGIILAGLEPQAGVFDDAYLEGIVRTIGVLRRAGLLVLVDVHQDYFTQSTGGEGFAEWMVTRRAPDGSAARPDAFPFDGFWADDGGVQAAFAEAWRHIAARLRAVPGVLGYDLFNEPFPGSREQECARLEGCPAFDRGVLNPFYRRVIAAVRAADRRRMVFYEPQVIFNQGAASSIGRLGDARAGFSFHVYCSERPSTPPCSQRRAGAFANAERQAARGRDALLLTEFGATDDLAEIGRVLDLADRHRVGWQEWAYWNEDPCCARDHEGLVRSLGAPPAGDNVKADKLAVLARPYPRAVAGTPRRWAWSASRGVFTAEWSTARAGGGRFARGLDSLLELPRAAFPRGYRATVTGGSVRSRPNARTVRIAAHRAARTVHVRITRR
jgi:endoglycosylceramidase